DVAGLDKMFTELQHLNPEIREAALIVDGQIFIGTDDSKRDKRWVSDPRTYEYIDNLSKPDQPRVVDLAVTVPVEVVYRRVEGSVRNLDALFVASAFLAGLF